MHHVDVQDMTAVVEGIRTYVSDRVQHVVFDRAEYRNALNLGMWEAIPQLMEEAATNEEVRAIAFSGLTAESFSAGADITEFTTVRSGVVNATKYNDAVREAEKAIVASSKPTLAYVRGWCVGGGCEVAVACDIRVGDSTARMGITPSKLGIVYGQTSTSRLVQEVGPGWARYMLLSARIFDAETSLHASLLQEVYADETADEQWLSLLKTITGGAPITQAGAKKLIARAVAGTDEEDEYADQWYRLSFESTEYARGVESFTTKHKPSFEDIPWPQTP